MSRGICSSNDGNLGSFPFINGSGVPCHLISSSLKLAAVTKHTEEFVTS